MREAAAERVGIEGDDELPGPPADHPRRRETTKPARRNWSRSGPPRAARPSTRARCPSRRRAAASCRRERRWDRVSARPARRAPSLPGSSRRVVSRRGYCHARLWIGRGRRRSANDRAAGRRRRWGSCRTQRRDRPRAPLPRACWPRALRRDPPRQDARRAPPPRRNGGSAVLRPRRYRCGASLPADAPRRGRGPGRRSRAARRSRGRMASVASGRGSPRRRFFGCGLVPRRTARGRGRAPSARPLPHSLTHALR